MSTDLRCHPRFIGLARAIDNCQFSATCVLCLELRLQVCKVEISQLISETQSDNGNVTLLDRKITGYNCIIVSRNLNITINNRFFYID